MKQFPIVISLAYPKTSAIILKIWKGIKKSIGIVAFFRTSIWLFKWFFILLVTFMGCS